MHDVNPLSTVMHLKELDRQAMAKLRPLRSDGPDRARFATAAAALVALLRRCLSGGTALAVTQTRRRWIAR
jgi:hypothetical protein